MKETWSKWGNQKVCLNREDDFSDEFLEIHHTAIPCHVGGINLSGKYRSPNDFMDSRRYRLFMAREVMIGLIRQTNAQIASQKDASSC